METQEFDEELQETNRIYKEIGDLNTKELLELQGAMKCYTNVVTVVANKI